MKQFASLTGNALEFLADALTGFRRGKYVPVYVGNLSARGTPARASESQRRRVALKRAA